jgi:hypothetical protein
MLAVTLAAIGGAMLAVIALWQQGPLLALVMAPFAGSLAALLTGTALALRRAGPEEGRREAGSTTDAIGPVVRMSPIRPHH